MKRIAIEEHYSSIRNFVQVENKKPQLNNPTPLRYPPADYKPGSQEILARTDDITEVRLREMGEAGIDMQVLCLAGAGPEVLDKETAIDNNYMNVRGKDGPFESQKACCYHRGGSGYPCRNRKRGFLEEPDGRQVFLPAD